MLCDECNSREARYTVSVHSGEETTVRHLCGQCVARLNHNFNAETVQRLLSSIMSAISGTPAPKKVEEAELTELPTEDSVCPRCGMCYSQYVKTGHLGCPGCYEAFREELQPMLQRIHGRVQHAGRHPLSSEAAQRNRQRQEELSRRMEAAIAQEDFETAALIRDELRAISREEREEKEAQRG